MADKLKVAVVGVGYLGRYHALIYSRLDSVELVGIFDTDQARAQAVAQEAGCQVFDDLDTLADAVEAASLVVPTSLHLEVARPMLERGVHLLIEKPIAHTVEEGRQIIALAKKHQALLQIGHLERFNAGVMALAGHISEPKFLEVHRMSPFVARATDVDVITDLMIHDIDIILTLIDADIAHISAVGTSVLTDHIDIANARIEFDNGAVANVVASRVSRDKVRRIRVFEPHRYLSLNFIDQALDLVYPKQTEGAQWPEIVTEKVDIQPVKPLDAELADFADCVVRQKKPLVDGQDGLRALEVALAVRDKIPEWED